MLQFSQDFNTPLPKIEYRDGDLQKHYGMVQKHGDTWIMTLDKDLVKISTRQQLKSLVYHEMGHAVLGLKDTDKKRHFMNPNCVLRSYKRLDKTINY